MKCVLLLGRYFSVEKASDTDCDNPHKYVQGLFSVTKQDLN